MGRLALRRLGVIGLTVAAAGCSDGRETAQPPRPAPVASVRCTDVWVGPDRGEWADARNWSRAAVPDRRSQACIPRERTVSVSRGRNEVWAVQGGAVDIDGGTLLLMGSALASELGELHLAHGVLGGPGKLIVTRRMRWGPGGQMLGVGDIVLGPGSRSVIATGTGPREGAIGGDDGTGPQPFDSKHAPAPACGPYSPPWATACALRHPADAAAIRRLWSHFAGLVNAGAPVVGLLAPRTCGDCGRVARAVAAGRPLLTELHEVYVEGDRAVSGTAAAGSTVRFRRVGGEWLVDEL